MKDHYDVIVIGAGIAGAVIAKFLGQRGIDVAVFEKFKFEEIHKICGDATSEWHFDKITEIDPKNVVDPPKEEEFYIRVGPSNSQLVGSELIEYVDKRFKKRK